MIFAKTDSVIMGVHLIAVPRGMYKGTLTCPDIESLKPKEAPEILPAMQVGVKMYRKIT